MLIRRLALSGQPLMYTLRRADTTRLSISVHPDLSVTAVAPREADPSEVDARVGRRLPWIVRQQLRFERYHPLPVPRRFVGGETHLYLGRQYRLRVRPGPAEVRLSGPFLWVTCERPHSRAVVKRLVDGWYRRHAPDTFSRRLVHLQSRAPWLRDVTPDRLKLRAMPRRWGSCTPGGSILLNPELVKAPVACIDYVLAHELCHLRVMDHSARFVRLLRSILADWERARDRLNAFGR